MTVGYACFRGKPEGGDGFPARNPQSPIPIRSCGPNTRRAYRSLRERHYPGYGVGTWHLLNGFGAVIDWLEPLRPLSPFYWYQGDTNPLDQTLGWQQPLLLAVGLAFVGAAVLLFRRRDIGT